MPEKTGNLFYKSVEVFGEILNEALWCLWNLLPEVLPGLFSF